MLVDDALSILNLTISDIYDPSTSYYDISRLTKVYHSLLLKYHPDRNRPLDQPVEKLKEYEQKFQEIRKAYDIIREWIEELSSNVELAEYKTEFFTGFYTGFKEDAINQKDNNTNNADFTGDGTHSEKYANCESTHNTTYDDKSINNTTASKNATAYHNIFQSTSVPFSQYLNSVQERADLRSLYLLFRNQSTVLRHAVWVEGRRKYLRNIIKEIAEEVEGINSQNIGKSKRNTKRPRGIVSQKLNKKGEKIEMAESPKKKIKKTEKNPAIISHEEKVKKPTMKLKLAENKEDEIGKENKIQQKKEGTKKGKNKALTSKRGNATSHSTSIQKPDSGLSRKPMINTIIPKSDVPSVNVAPQEENFSSDPSLQALKNAIFAQQKDRHEKMLKTLERKYGKIMKKERELEEKATKRRLRK